MKDGNYAVLDLGTNTFNLLVVNVDNKVKTIVDHDRVSVKIGKGGIQNNEITDDACQRAVDAMKHFRGIIDKNKVKDIRAIATSAFRNAHNGRDLSDRIRRETGIEVNIINGEKEAEFIYYGVKSALEIGEEVSLIMDIGGGSVEFIICDERHIFWKKSYEIGAQRLLDMFHKQDPINPTSIENMYGFLSESLTELQRQVKMLKPTVLIGSSGTFDTLCEIYIREFNIDYVLDSGTEFELPLDYFDTLFHKLATKNVEQRREIKGMSEMRADMIVVATCLIDYIVKTYNLKKIRTSFYSLKEGVLYLMNN